MGRVREGWVDFALLDFTPTTKVASEYRGFRDYKSKNGIISPRMGNISSRMGL